MQAPITPSATSTPTESKEQLKLQVQKDSDKPFEAVAALSLPLQNSVVTNEPSTTSAGNVPPSIPPHLITAVSDIDNLPPDELKTRIKLLLSELTQRTQWESILLHQTIKQTEESLRKEYQNEKQTVENALKLQHEKDLAEQRQKLLSEYESAVRSEQSKMDGRLHEIIRAQAEGFQNTLKS